MTDIATRVYNHTWKIDPIVRSVLDTDFYKLLMAQTIFRRHKDAKVTFGILNRTRSVRLARLVDVGVLREQLDHIRTLSLSRGESTWLRGNSFYGKRPMFSPDFIQWLEGFRFPAYHLERTGDQYELTFEEAPFLTLGLCYEGRGRFSGGAYHPVLKRIDGFLPDRLPAAIEKRAGRRDLLFALDDAVTSAVAALKERGFESPYLRNFVLARVNPLRFQRGKPAAADFDDTFGKMEKSLAKFDPAKVNAAQLARASGPPEETA